MNKFGIIKIACVFLFEKNFFFISRHDEDKFL